METKIIKFGGNRIKCRKVKLYETIQAGDLVNPLGKWRKTQNEGNRNYGAFEYYRPILSPKKAKGKAFAKIKPVLAWGYTYPIGAGKRSLAVIALAGLPDIKTYLDRSKGNRLIRVEIRPLVTRKKGK